VLNKSRHRVSGYGGRLGDAFVESAPPSCATAIGCTRRVSNAAVAVTPCLLDLLGAHLMRLREFMRMVHIVLLSVRVCCVFPSHRCNYIQEDNGNSSNRERRVVN